MKNLKLLFALALAGTVSIGIASTNSAESSITKYILTTSELHNLQAQAQDTTDSKLKKGAKKGVDGVETGGKAAVKGTKKGGKAVGKGAKKGGKTVGKGAKKGGKAVKNTTKKGVDKVGDAVD